MNAIALGMNLFLAVLLLAALVMGWRLNIRLRGVRDSQALFVKAVTDLDAATGRAHAGLAELRMATEEAIDLLGGRIVRAKEAADRLDRALSDTEMMARQPVAARQPAREPIAAPPSAPAQQQQVPQHALATERAALSRPFDRIVADRTPRADALAPTSLRGLLDLAEGRGLTPPTAPVQTRTSFPAPRPATSFVDDDLFVGGGLR